MSKIELEQISENEVEVVFPPETPMEMVQQLVKGLHQRGLIEDLSKSTLSVRYFSRPQDKTSDVADELIKSLSRLTKSDGQYWAPKSQMDTARRNREADVADRRAKNGVKQPSNVSTAPEPHVVADKPAAPPKMYDNTPGAMNTAGGTGRRYATINDPVGKGEHVEGCQCDKCLDMEKSNYKGAGISQYNPADNARRKASNVGDVAGEGPNRNVKAYSSKPGQMSNKAQADLTARIQNAANKKQPVKQYSPEEVAQLNAQRGLKKTDWAQHNAFPSAEEEIMRLAQAPAPNGDEAAANQLAALMLGKSMLGQTPPAQPTNEQLFGGGVVTDEMAKSADNKWNNSFNNWMVEASKPITERFASQAEEDAYWANIKIGDRDDGGSGY